MILIRAKLRNLALLTLFGITSAQGSPLQCRIEMLESLGWHTVADTGVSHTDSINTCDTFGAEPIQATGLALISSRDSGPQGRLPARSDATFRSRERGNRGADALRKPKY